MWLLLSFISSAAACAFSRSGLSKPAGHPALAATSGSSDLPNAPGVPYADLHNQSLYPYPGYDMPSASWIIPRTIANLSAQHNATLCYWSQQVLPSPPTGFDPASRTCTPSPCQWASPPSAADVRELMELADQAISRMQYMVDVSFAPGGVPAFVGSQCGSGYANIRVLCKDVDPANPVCNATGLKQRSEWAVASNILAITPDTLSAVYYNVSAWRTSPELHIPSMTSSLVSKGWGAGGAISFKVLPCSAIPAPLLGHSYGCNQVDTSTGNLVWDEAFAFWQSYQTPTWLHEALQPLVSPH